MKRLSILLAVSLVLAGCVSTGTVQSRKQQRMAAYEALSPEMRDAVDHGQLKAGMSMDAVYIAWGPPSRTLAGGNESGETTTWDYLGTYFQQTIWTGWRVHYAYTSVPYTRAEVVFANGRVKEWRSFAAPTGYY
jgi:hypothetical protein